MKRSAFVTSAVAVLSVAAAVVLVSAFAACKATKVYPDALPGWHDASFSTVFGRLQRIASRNQDNPPVWIIRFGTPNSPYHGELAITPPERLTGYSGGEQVEVKGKVRPDLSYPDYMGTWYEVQSIRMWSPRR